MGTKETKSKAVIAMMEQFGIDPNEWKDTNVKFNVWQTYSKKYGKQDHCQIKFNKRVKGDILKHANNKDKTASTLDMLKAFNLNPDEWEIQKSSVNVWQVYSKATGKKNCSQIRLVVNRK